MYKCQQYLKKPLTSILEELQLCWYLPFALMSESNQCLPPWQKQLPRIRGELKGRWLLPVCSVLLAHPDISAAHFIFEITGDVFIHHTNNSMSKRMSEKTSRLINSKSNGSLTNPCSNTSVPRSQIPGFSATSLFPRQNCFRQQWDSNYSSRCLVIMAPTTRLCLNVTGCLSESCP